MSSGTAHRIASDLIAKIEGGVLEPGDRLKELELTEVYDVSRGPIREALRTLAALDWITLEPGKGARVASLEDEQNLDSIAVSSVLFGLSCRLACSRLTEDQLARLTKTVRKLSNVTDGGDEHRFFAHSREAWFLIVEAIHSPVISQFFDRSARGAMVNRARKSFENPDVRRGIAELWKELVVAFRLRDQDRAEEIGRRIPMYSLEELLRQELSA